MLRQSAVRGGVASLPPSLPVAPMVARRCCTRPVGHGSVVSCVSRAPGGGRAESGEPRPHARRRACDSRLVARAGPSGAGLPYDDTAGDEVDEGEYDEGEGGLDFEDEDDEGQLEFGEEPDESMLSAIQDELRFGGGDDEEAAHQERLRSAQDAASSSRGEGSSAFPEPEERGYFISDLFGKAAYLDAAQVMDAEFPDTVVYGLQANPMSVIRGDMYVCLAESTTDVPALVVTALSNAAAALLLPEFAEGAPEMEGCVPEGVPVHYVPAVAEVAHRLAVAFYDAPGRDLLCIGVIGSHGKTTTSWLVCGILEAMEQVTGTVNSIGYSLSGELLDVDGELYVAPEDDKTEELESSAPFRVTPYNDARYSVTTSTPPGLQTTKLLAGMRDRGATCAVLELSSAGLAAGHADFVELSVAVHTGFSGAGLADFDGDREAALEAQLAPFENLLDPSAQAAVVNLDDPCTPELLERLGSVPIVSYGIDRPDADVVAEKASFSIWESELLVRTPLGRLQIITPLLGKHNVYNVLAAVATGIALKVPLVNIVAGIEAVEVIPGRCEIVDEGQNFSVIVDAADTPEALDAMLSALRGNARNIYTVFGCRGEEDRDSRPRMAEVAHAKSDIVIMTNDSPRREAPEAIVKDLVAGLPDEIVNKYSGYVYFPFQDQGRAPLWFEPYLQKAQRDNRRYIMEDRFSAIRAAIGTAGPDDVVVIAGRGHVDVMEYWDGVDGVQKGWLDDRVEARSALQKLSILQQLDGKLDRKVLPWGKALDQMDTIISM